MTVNDCLSLRTSAALASIIILISTAFGRNDQAGAQSTKPAEEKAEKIVQRGLEVVGGTSYVNVRTVIGRGLFAQYKDGAPEVPSKFVDYIVYPDKERTEFTNGGVRTILANSSGRGWIFDGMVKNLKDQKSDQLEDFKTSMRTGFENLLHGWWRKEGATLSYAGRREAGLARRNETVRVTYPEGFWVEYEFDAKDGLPSKVIYKRKRKNPDTDEAEEITEEDRLLKPLTIDGIVTPFVIDHFVNGVQTSRISYDSVEYNRQIADSLFDKPANIKGLK